MYTAKILGKALKNGQMTISVRYTSEQGGITESITINAGQDTHWLKSVIKKRCDELGSLDSFHGETVTGDVDLTDEVVTPAVPPTYNSTA